MIKVTSTKVTEVTVVDDDGDQIEANITTRPSDDDVIQLLSSGPHQCVYVTPAEAREFAAALVQLADQLDGEAS